MNSHQRRVRKLSLSAPDEALVRRGVILLEDALRTASVPGADEGRLLIVRSLSVGRIDSNRSSANLSLAIEQQLHQLSANAIHAEAPAASTHSAVYFENDAEPYIRLAVRLSRQETTDDWFWPLAVPSWRPAMPRDEALRHLLGGVIETRAGVTAAVAMIRELHELRVVEGLLSALRWQDGPALLQAFGWSKPNPLPLTLVDGSSAKSSVEVPIARWSPIFENWVGRWGTNDARSIWLAAMVLATEKPVRLVDAQLPSRAQRLIIAATSRTSLPPSVGPSTSKVTVEEADPTHTTSVLTRPTDAAPRRAPAPTAPHQQTTSGQEAAGNQAPPPSAKTPLPLFTEEEHPSGSVERRTTSASSDETGAGESARPRPVEISGSSGAKAQSRKADEKATSFLTAGKDTSLVAKANPLDSASPQTEAAPPKPDTTVETSAAADLHIERRSLSPRWPGVPRPTAFAGLFFLLPIMSRLGISALLETNSQLIELALPERLLRQVAERLAIPADDPVLSFLSASASADSGAELSRIEFINSADWRRGLSSATGPLIIRRVKNVSEARVLFDASGRLALALWRGRAPQGVRDLIGDLPVRRGARSVSPAQEDLTILIEAWQTAMRRWCRRYARLGLHDLVCRPGRIIATRTHIDIFFDHRQADVRIRKAGLDLDPGWVPWFGRVVQFQYLYGV